MEGGMKAQPVIFIQDQKTKTPKPAEQPQEDAAQLPRNALDFTAAMWQWR